jgi:hypothetical protein
MSKAKSPAHAPGVLDNYLSRPHAAAQLGKHTRTLERWERLRIGPAVVRIGKSPMYRREAIRDWLLKQEHQPIHKTGAGRKQAVRP